MQPPQRPSSSRACFCYSKARPTPSPNSHGAATTDRISELQELRISELQKRVQAACVEHTRIEAALDSEAPKAALVALVLEQEDKLRQELAQLTLSALQRRALASGVDRDAVDAALDGEGREALQALILESEARDSPAPRPGPEHAAADADSSAEPAAARVHLSDAHARAGGEGQPSDALRRELEPLRLKQLRARARDAGIDAEALEDALDSDQPKATVIALLVAGAEARAAGVTAETARLQGAPVAGSRAEYKGLKTMALYARAIAAGVDAAKAEDAMEHTNPKDALIALLLETHAADAGADAASRRQELEGLRVMELHRRALESGGRAEVEAAMESDTPKVALIELLVARVGT